MIKKGLITLILLACSACGKSEPKLNKLPDDAVILAFGDSLTYGTGASKGHDYPNELSELTGTDVINAGVPGEVTGKGRQRLPTLLDEYEPDLLILIHGGNDFLRKLPKDKTRDNLEAMIAEAKRRNIAVLLIGVPEIGLFLHSAPMYAEIAEAQQIPNDSEVLPDILSSRELKSDPVHLNNEGYRRLAEHIAALLKERGAL